MITNKTKAITKEQMLPLLVDASPGFKPEWEEFLREWKDDFDKPYYCALGDFAHYLVNKFLKHDTTDFQYVFLVIEDLHVFGDHYVREAATVGLLEGIQNIMLNKDEDPEVFKPFLLKETTRWWDKLNKFWSEGIIMTDED